MENVMKIDGAKVRTLREQRGWSQDHLATTSALSLRTIQRVESEGAASSETRMALAAAFQIAAVDLQCASPAPSPKRPRGVRIGYFCGIAGIALGAISSAAGILSGATGGGEMGVEFGVWGVCLGLSSACFGLIVRRVEQRSAA